MSECLDKKLRRKVGDGDGDGGGGVVGRRMVSVLVLGEVTARE